MIIFEEDVIYRVADLFRGADLCCRGVVVSFGGVIVVLLCKVVNGALNLSYQ